MRLLFIPAACLLLSLTVLNSCKGMRKSANEPVQFKLNATVNPYTAAMGSGRGVIFQVYFLEPKEIEFDALEVDSLIVHGINVGAEKTKTGSAHFIEANYFKAEQELPAGNGTPIPVTDAPDPIIYLSQYQPAYLYLHYHGIAYTLPIESFQKISK